MNGLLNTEDLKRWTHIEETHRLKKMLKRMQIPFIETDKANIATTIESVQNAFNASEVDSQIQLIRLNEVLEMCKVSKSTLYNHTKARTFPKSHLIGKKICGWRKAEIILWLEGKRDWDYS